MIYSKIVGPRVLKNNFKKLEKTFPKKCSFKFIYFNVFYRVCSVLKLKMKLVIRFFLKACLKNLVFFVIIGY